MKINSVENKKTALILGGTVPHKYLIDNLKARGYRTILIDYYENPPAASIADMHIKESTLDQNKVLEIAEKEKASLVISGCVDQANVTACYVAEKLGLPTPYSYETALRVTDKELMKAGLIKAGVPTAAYQVVKSIDIDQFKANSYPLVVKPSDCNGSKGVKKVRNAIELKQALIEACNLSRSRKAIVEDYNIGKEISAYFVICNGASYSLYIKRKDVAELNGETTLRSFMTIGPEILTREIKNKLISSVNSIASEFKLNNTPILIQANITNDNIYIIEFAPRVGGGLAFREISYLTDFDIINAVVNSYIGYQLHPPRYTQKNMKSCILHLYGSNGIYHSTEGLEYLISSKAIEEYHFHKTPGMPMSSDDLSSKNRVLGLIIQGSNCHEIYFKIKKVKDNLKIINTDGNNTLYKEPLVQLLEKINEKRH